MFNVAIVVAMTTMQSCGQMCFLTTPAKPENKCISDLFAVRYSD